MILLNISLIFSGFTTHHKSANSPHHPPGSVVTRPPPFRVPSPAGGETRREPLPPLPSRVSEVLLVDSLSEWLPAVGSHGEFHQWNSPPKKTENHHESLLPIINHH
jgi:hypothetical protein